MLQILDTINKSIILKPVTGVQWTSAWGDSFGSSFVEGSWQGTSSSSSDSNVVPAPGANTRRVIKSVTLYNSSSEVKEVVLVFKDGGNEVIISKASLAPNETWYSSKTSTSLLATGNKGDITVNGNGSWTINTNAVTSTKILDGAVTSSKIALDSVTYAQLQPVSFSNRLLGRGSTAGTLDVEEISIGTGLSMSGTTLNNTGVTSVGLSAPSFLTVSGSPVTTSGTLTLALATQTANTVFAGPTTGIAAAPTFRALVAGDIPDLSSIYQPLDADLTAIAALTANGLLRKTAGVWAMDSASYLTTNQTITLSGDVTGSGTTAITATIANNAVTTAKILDASVTLAKMANLTADRVIGRSGTTGVPQELTLSQVLEFGGPAAQGDILYRGASTWERLGAGTRGRYLQTGGAGANPSWAQAATFKNVIINGDMRIDQRNNGSSVTINTAARSYFVDRWFAFGQASDGEFTVQRSTTAPTGFVNSILATVTKADTNIEASQLYLIGQYIEGFNAAHFLWGTANALTVTLSFWVRSSITGTFGGAIRNGTNNRSYPFTYTIDSTDTFEYKTITIPGDTSGTWATNNTSGPQVFFSLATGPTLSGTAGAWNGNNNVSATGAVNFMNQTLRTFYLTGVQLEPGPVATEFEYVPYDMQFLRCYRYLPSVNYYVADFLGADYYFGVQAGVGNYYMWVNFLVPARTHPVSITISSAADFKIFSSYNSLNYTPTTLVCITSSNKTALIDAAAGGVAAAIGSVAYMRFESPTSGNPRILFNGCEL